jgi:hypothetical protein
LTRGVIHFENNHAGADRVDDGYLFHLAFYGISTPMKIHDKGGKKIQ